MSLAQLTREGCGSEAHEDSPGRLLCGALKEKGDAPLPDLSAFLSQEELDKSVDLACKAISEEPQDNQHKSPHSAASDTASLPTAQPSIPEKTLRNVRTSREPPPDFKRPSRNAPYGLETQSKKEFLNKAADFIEELSSLFKANSAKRVRPRSCKGQRSRPQSKAQPDGTSCSSRAEHRERALEFHQQNQEEQEEPAPGEPPLFIQKLKSREVPEGSKVQLDCTVRGLPTPEVRWFCEDKELESCPDIQIISIGDRHSLIIAEAFEEDTGRYSCSASNFCGSDSTSAEIYVEGASSSDSDGEQHLQAQAHRRASPPPQTPPDTSDEDPTPPVKLSSPAASASHTHMTFDPPPVQEDPEPLTHEIISPQIAEPESTNLPQTTGIEPAPAPSESPSSPPDISEMLSTSQQSNPENLNGSSSFLQSFDVRPIMAAPVFTKNLQEVLAQEGQLVVLEGRVKGFPSPKVNWYREGTLIDDSPDFRILQKKPRSMAESEEICTLVIAEVFPEDSGTFTCTASNKYGTVSSIAALRVTGCNNKSSKATSLLMESCDQKISDTSSVKCDPDAPLLNNTFHSSLASLDSWSSDSQCTETRTPDSSILRHDLATSLPNLNPLSIGQLHSDTFRSSLPHLDPLSLSISSFEPLNSDSKHKLLNSFSSRFDSDDSGFKSEVTEGIPNGSTSAIRSDVDDWIEPSQNIHHSPSIISPPQTNSSNHQGHPSFKPLLDPPTSCLKTRSEGVLANHNESRSSSRVGLRVTFKLPEEEEEEEKSMAANKAPPPVLTKPKLDPVQLQILHNQVLLEQQQDKVSPSQESPHSDRTNLETQSSPNSVSSQLRSPHVMNSAPIPQVTSASVPVQPIIKTAPAPQLSTSLPSSVSLPQLSPLVSNLFNNPSTPQPNLASSALLNNIVVPSSQTTVMLPPAPLLMPPVPQLNMFPVTPMMIPFSPITAAAPIIPQSNQFITPLTTQPNTNSMVNMSPISPPTRVSQINMTPSLQMYSAPISETDMIAAKTLDGSAVLNNTVAKIHTTPVTQPGMAPPLMQDAKSRSVFIPQMSKVLSNPPAPVSVPPLSSSQTFPVMSPISTQTFPAMSPISTQTFPAMSPISTQTFSAMSPISTQNLPAMSPISTQNLPVMSPISTQNLPVMSPISTQTFPAMSPISTQTFPAMSPISTQTFPAMSPISTQTFPAMSPNSTQTFPAMSPISTQNLPAMSPISTQNLPVMSPISTQSFNYTRPKEFIAAQTLSPIKSPSPTESPVPMLHELAAQLFPKSTRELMSPINQFAPSLRKLPTRILECPSSPPAYVSSPPLIPPVFSFGAQSPPQASSPTSSCSSPSPIQNPVAFLSSVLPSLPTSPPTNAMGLPKRAPPGPQGVLKKNQRSFRSMSEEDIRDSRETLLKDIERKLLLKDDSLHIRQQEYKVSNFEQRLMSEIEFRLERTPVEESDEEVQHEEIPSGKCIAPMFDKKLKHFRAIEGVPVTFTCKVLGIPIPKVYWFKDGKQILRKNEHYQKIREGDGTCSLHIQASTGDDDGNYTVMAANPQGRISCSGHLIIQTGPVRNRPVVHSQRVRARVQEVEGEPAQERFFSPHFLQAPGDMSAHEGRVCRFDCKVSGLPHPEIMWLLNGKPLYPDPSHRMLVRENGIHSLLMDPLTQADDGTYTCIAANKAGQSSFCLELRVVEKEMKTAPRFVEKLQNTGVAEGALVRMDCRVMGMPQPLIYWKKDNDTISPCMERLSMHQDTTGYLCLLIQPTRKEDAGWYTVSAKNEAGITSCTARLDIYAQWHQHVHPPMRKTQQTGSRYAALSDQGLQIKSVFHNSDAMFSSSRSESSESK